MSVDIHVIKVTDGENEVYLYRLRLLIGDTYLTEELTKEDLIKRMVEYAQTQTKLRVLREIGPLLSRAEENGTSSSLEDSRTMDCWEKEK